MRYMSSILRNATRLDSDKLNILVGPTHEAYEENLCKTGHNFYAFQHNHFKTWNSKYRPLPSNYILLDKTKDINQIPLNVDIDLVLSANKFGQFQILSDVANKLGVPLLSIEHTLPFPAWSQQQLQNCRNMRGKFNLFISEYSINAWGWEDKNDTGIVHHAIDSEIFKPSDVERELVCLSVVNDWINRDWCCGFNIWKNIVQKYKLPVKVLGDTPGLSVPASSTQELAENYQKSRVFLNTSTISPVPTVLLEAMSSECAVVSTATCMIPDIIVNGVNGFISNNEDELGNYCKLLLQDKELAEKMGKAARQTVLERFNLDQFLNTWNNSFQRTLNW